MSRLVVTLQLVGALACLFSCELETAVPSSPTGKITAFVLTTADNPNLSRDVTGKITNTSITSQAPAGTDVTSLVPTIWHTGERVSPASGVSQDFTDPVPYTVTAEDGSKRSYAVSVSVAAASSKDIRSFRIDSTLATIDGTDITLTLPYGTDLTRLAPEITHSGVEIDPASDSEQDFSTPVTYTVSAQDGSTKEYTVTIHTAASDQKEITALEINGVKAQINGTQIALTLPSGTDLRALDPQITHTGSSVEPASGDTQDFRLPVKYTVTAADGSSQEYTVIVKLALSSAKNITSFSIDGAVGEISGSLVSVTVPYGTDVTYLAPIVQHTGAAVNPASTAPRDFTEPLTYTVTAADGSTQEYTVTVRVAQSSAKDLIDFVILGSSGQINDATVTLTVPYAASLTALIPTIVHSGVKLEPASGVVRDFTDPVQYVVTAANGSTRTYTVIVKRAKSSDNSITQFTLLGTDAQVSDNSISVTLPYGTDVSSVAPRITHTGASIEPAVGTLLSFGVERIYTVTAANGDTRQYTVHITIAPNTSKTITSFELLGRRAQIDGTAITVTLPHGTNVTSLAPDIMHTGASIEPEETEPRDFTQPVTYVVRAANNSTATYTVTVTVAQNDARAITRFTILNRNGQVGASSIALTVPFNTDLSDLTPTIEITGESIAPESGVAQDFRQPVTYTVTAENGATRSYVVTVTAALSSAKGLSNFQILGKTATIDGTSVNLTLPYGTDRSLLMPTFTSSGASVQPPSGMPQDFTLPVTYRVTAADSSFRDYTVTVTLAQNSAKNITDFTVENVSGDIGSNTITVTLPYNSILTSLAPQITLSGGSVLPASNVPQDFTEPRTYTVTAADGSMKQYTVTVTSVPHAIDCRALLAAAPATISGVHTIDPDGAGSIAPFSVYCDMSQYGGGWTLVGKTAAGDYTALSNNNFLDLILNPRNDVNAGLLQSDAVPNAGEIGFYSKTKTNALYHASGALRALRIDMSNHQVVAGANDTFFQQRVSAPANWDFWLALRNAKLWNRDGSEMAMPNDQFVAHFGEDFVLTNLASDFNVATNVVTQRGDDTTYGFYNIYEHTLPDGETTVQVSRHLGLLNDGVSNLSDLWLLTADPTDGTAPSYLDTRYKNDSATQQKALIWLR